MEGRVVGDRLEREGGLLSTRSQQQSPQKKLSVRETGPVEIDFKPSGFTARIRLQKSQLGRLDVPTE